MKEYAKPKSKGRKNTNEHLIFSHLYNENVERDMVIYSKTKKSGDYLTKFLELLNGYYGELLEKSKKTHEEIEELPFIIKSLMRDYKPEYELNGYFYLKKNLELYYDLYDKNRYFDKAEEYAMVKYIEAKDDSKKQNYIYNKFLKNAFYKLTENIINTYKLYSDEMSYEDLHSTCLSFVHEQLYKFDVTRGSKAYSYYGTTIKHYLIGLRKKEKKKRDVIHSFENYHSLEEDERYVYHDTHMYESNITLNFFKEIPDIIKNHIIDNDNVNEVLVGRAIIEIFSNWEELFTDGSKKFHRNQYIQLVKELTGLNTKEVRNAMNTYKSLYISSKQKQINSEYNEFEGMI